MKIVEQSLPMRLLGCYRLYRNRVLTLGFCEMLLSGFVLEESAAWTPSNVAAQFEQRGVWCWHLPFFWLPHVPEMLIQGKADEFYTHFVTAECYNPTAIPAEVLQEWIRGCKVPGGLRGVLETYRAAFVNAETNRSLGREKLTLPVLIIGAPE